VTRLNEAVQSAQQIEAVLKAWAEAAATKDARNMRRFYADDVVVFDIFPPLAHQGADGHCAVWQGWFDKLDGPISFEIQNAVMQVNGDLGTVFCVTRINTGQAHDLVRTTLVMSKIDEDWLICHVHTSVPLPVELVPSVTH